MSQKLPSSACLTIIFDQLDAPSLFRLTMCVHYVNDLVTPFLFRDTMKLTLSCQIQELFRRLMHNPRWPMGSFINTVDSQPPQLEDHLVAREEIVTLPSKVQVLSPQIPSTLLTCSLAEASRQTWLPQ